MPKGRSKESHLLKASLTPLIYSHKHRAPWHSEETHSQWLERLLYFDESVGCISRNKEARLQNLHILFKIMSPKSQSHTASFFHANMHDSSFKILRSTLSLSGQLANTYLGSYTKITLSQGCLQQAWYCWDTRDSAVKHIAQCLHHFCHSYT